MCDTCDDSRFELIEKYKQKLIESTNISDSPEEMAVIDNILFRFWQMGWLVKFERFGNSEQLESGHEKDHVADPGKKVGDLISRAEALEAMDTWDKFGCAPDGKLVRYDDNKHYVPYVHYDDMVYVIKALPSAQPFHNITMNDVLKYIDGMPEDVWQEFVACLECRGWELQRRTAKWCGSEFA